MLFEAISPFKRLKGESGQDTVEFALILPILLTMVFGIIDFGWVFFNIAMVNNMARSGCRYAIVNVENTGDIASLDADVTLRVQNGLPGYLTKPAAHFDVIVSESTTAASPNDDCIDVEVKTDIPLFTPVISTFTGHTYYRYDKKVSMRKES